MRRSAMDASGVLLAAMVLVLVGGAATVYFASRTDPVREALSGDRIINTLFLVEEEGKPLVAHVVMYYPATRRAALFDVPGNLGLIIKSLGRVDRIDALYDPASPQAFVDEVETVLDVDIPFFLVLDLDAYSKLVDLLGGIEVFIADRVDVRDEGKTTLLPSGSVLLDGAKAVSFLSLDVGEEDEGERWGRRHRGTLALLKRLGERKDFLRDPAAGRLFRSFVRTNLDEKALAGLLEEMSAVDPDRIPVQRVGGNLKDVSGQALLFPYYDGSLIKDIVKQSLASLTREGEGGAAERVYTVEVLNGTTVPGLARRAADLLQDFGYEPIVVANAERSDAERTEIVDRSGVAGAAKEFGALIRCASIREEEASSSTSLSFEGGADFTIVIGKDFDGRYVIR